jgi:MFS family permease
VSGTKRFALAAAMFLVAVVNRSSLGVTGTYAEGRFGIGPGELSLFVMVQLGIYAVLQMPAGALVDRYGPRRTLVCAGVLMGSAQLLFATSRDYPIALVARVVLGCGDALTFVSVLRVAFSSGRANRYPALVALAQLVGFAGHLLATLPLLVLMRSTGWELTYGGLAVATGIVAVAIQVGLRDGRSEGSQLAPPLTSLVRGAKQAWGAPETRLGFWMHFSCLASATTFLLLWGYPYLHRGAGLSDAAAGSVLFAGVLVSAVLMPLAGWLFGARPGARVPAVLVVTGSTAGGWALLLTLGGDSPPHAAVVALFVLSMSGVPACGAAYGIAGDHAEPALVSTATGIVNAGGYLATVLAATGIGLVLQASSGASDAAAFRPALGVMVGVQTLGIVRVTGWRRRLREGACGALAYGASVRTYTRDERAVRRSEYDERSAGAGARRGRLGQGRRRVQRELRGRPR